MTVAKLAQSLNLEQIVMPEPNREVTCGYVGDLLSWVMGRAPEDSAWITIMSNINVIAVATLADTACIILAEGVRLDEGVAETASSKGVNVLGSDKSAYELSVLLGELL